MHCRDFRAKHLAFVDDTLPAIEMAAMERHLGVCPRCARHDTLVRRSLLLVHNIRPIEPSAEFRGRLEARLREVREIQHTSAIPHRPHGPSFSAFSVLAAGVALAAYVALEAQSQFGSPEPIRMPPVVASIPEPMPLPVTDAAFIATVPVGLPVWPAMLVADEAPMHLVNAEFRPGDAR